MNRQAWLKMATEVLDKAGIADAAADAWLLLSHSTGLSRMDYSLERTVELKETELVWLTEGLEKRKRHIPVQQITGKAWFMGYPFCVNEHVLIPRLDTEVLIEAVLQRVQKIPTQDDGQRKLLDMCTGSGCILLSLLKEEPSFRGTGVDISTEALQVAEKNAGQLEASCLLVHSDLFEKVEDIYSVIVSNPPYIVHEVMETLDPEVREHEPALALDGGEDGLSFYRRIVKEAGAYLCRDGLLAFEIGYDQGEALRKLLSENGYGRVEIIRDLAGLDRVALGWKKQSE